MQIATEPGTSSKVSRFSDPNVTSVMKEVGSAGPCLRRVVVIRRTTPSKKVISFHAPTRRKLNDPTSFIKNNSQSVQKKYSNEVKKKRNFLEEALIKECGNLAFLTFESMLNSEKTDPILYRLFISSAYTINNYFGKQGPQSVDSNDLYMYIHKLIPIGKNNQTVFYEVAKGIKPPEFYINFIIVEASDLKGMNSLSNMFCKVWMNGDPKWIEMTNTVASSARLIWNTRFVFRSEDFSTDAITIEMYQAGQALIGDDKPSVKVSGIRKLFRRLSGTWEGDEQSRHTLVGKIELRIRDIYSEGVDEWVPLICPNPEYDSLSLHVEATFRVRSSENRLEELKRHLLLMRTCVDHSFKVTYNPHKVITDWEQLLNRSATTLIFLHSVICGLTPSEDVMSRFAVVAYMGKKADTVSIELLYCLLLETTEYLRQYPDDVIENRLQLMFEKEAKDFYEYCFQFISSVHSRKLATERSMLSEFEFALRSIYLCEYVIDVAVAPLSALKSESINWIEKKADKMKEAVPDNRATYVIEFLDYFMQYQKVVDKVIQKVIPNETLTKLIYKQMDEKLLEPLKMHTTEFSRVFVAIKDTQDGDSARKDGMRLFSKIKEFLFYICKTTQTPVLNLKLAKFRDWFGRPVITDWFQWMQMSAEKDIEKSVKNDNLHESDYSILLDQRTKLSTSSEKMCEIIQMSLRDLWNLVSIPRSQKCDEMFVDGVHNCCIVYANLMLDTIHSRKLLEEFHFDGRRSLCMLVNNIRFVAASAEIIIQDTLGTMPANFLDCRRSLEDLCDKICSHIIDNLMEDIIYLTDSIIENNRVKDGVDTFTLYDSFMKKIIWKQIFREMSSDVFITFLKRMSKRIIAHLRRCIEQWEIPIKDKNDRKRFFRMILKVLSVTKEICSIPGSLEENEKIWGENYTTFLSELEDNV